MPAHSRRFSLSAINQQNALRTEVGQTMADLGVRVCYSDELPWQAASAARSMLGYYDERGRGIVCFTFKDLPYKVMNPAYEHLHEDSDFNMDDAPLMEKSPPVIEKSVSPQTYTVTCCQPIVHHTPRQIKIFRSLKKKKRVRVDY